MANTFRLRNHYGVDLASAKAEIRHVFGDTPITEARTVNSNKTGTLREAEILKPRWRKLKLVL